MVFETFWEWYLLFILVQKFKEISHKKQHVSSKMISPHCVQYSYTIAQGPSIADVGKFSLSTPLRPHFFTPTRQQIWQIFDPSTLKNADVLKKWMVPQPEFICCMVSKRTLAFLVVVHTVWRKYVQLDDILTAIRHETLLLIWGPVHHRPCCTYISTVVHTALKSGQALDGIGICSAQACRHTPGCQCQTLDLSSPSFVMTQLTLSPQCAI